MDLENFLEQVKDPDLRQIVHAIAEASVSIDQVLRNGVQDVSSSAVAAAPGQQHNAFGDAQLSEDLTADHLARSRLLQVPCVSYVSSEENPTEQRGPGHKYAVAFDPLDGSSVLESNFSVGSIFGVWRTAERLVGCQGRDMVAAAVTLYGPRLVLVVAVDPGLMSSDWPGGVASFRWTTSNDARWRLLKQWSPDLLRHSSASLFAPGNLRATQELPPYDRMVRSWIESRYTLRYSGAMAPDVFQIIAKGQGIFCNPSVPGKAKLRLVYEALPLAFLVEAVGGRSSDGSRTSTSLLDKRITLLIERTPVVLGSPSEVQRYIEAMNET
ncbi:sedoheptulose-1,7-bisphosphatase [Cyanidioschyzon merolae strain 10D]|uniref:Sedoheptulose-1,7-bisphosphatase n=1 Tax=Cyanidioschyzon merolae (strain NIES-3377 / 10D) TaxID=280699 RepID=M1VCR7_CYAM1|nr:sedoheptulose-1,7-bisphosphatase [Cyanidioschyzon merolae strain 10D]BAM83314.1 sedoheptulose-1,7-bisphosphatase [Cyanidioschyzon merolae strain 10D]|eukprot:XP_005539350.1 sedoheptulose-1,7-bisphosphatase [Cyanidioschyzon merolae strain 10D]